MKAIVLSFILAVLTAASVCSAAEPVSVAGVIDGETIQLTSGEKVRLIGIDVPASSQNVKLREDMKSTGKDAATLTAVGKNATKFLRKALKNENVVLEYDASGKDKSGRRGAYVYLYLDPQRNVKIPEDWYAELIPDTQERQLRVFLNATMIRTGYAQAMTPSLDVKRQELFLKMQKEAQEQKKGLWK